MVETHYCVAQVKGGRDRAQSLKLRRQCVDDGNKEDGEGRDEDGDYKEEEADGRRRRRRGGGGGGRGGGSPADGHEGDDGERQRPAEHDLQARRPRGLIRGEVAQHGGGGQRHHDQRGEPEGLRVVLAVRHFFWL
jgi:hypothetical protein